MRASIITNISLLPSKFSSRMESAYELPNNTLFITSSETGSVFVINQKEEIVWELGGYYFHIELIRFTGSLE